MKKFLSLIACVAFVGALSAQTTTTETKSEPAKTEKSGCAKGEAKAGCCAGKAKASADTKAVASGDAANATAPKAGCCAGKASAASCHGAKAHAHDHAHAEMKEHACTEACKDGAHTYACGEKGHTCSETCHAHKL